MEFTFETQYNQKAITAMAEALRKTVRKRRSRRSHVFGWIVIALALLMTLPIGGGEWVIDAQTIVTWAAIAAIVAVFLFEDKLNAYIAKKRMLTGTDKATSVFDEEKYVSVSAMGKTEWNYANIQMIAESKEYFIFIFDKSHAQVYEKAKLTGGTAEEFRVFISERTGKEVVKI